MERDFKPLQLREPEKLARRREKPRLPPSSDLAITQRVSRAADVQAQVRSVSKRFRRLTPEQRRAFFVKIKHAGPISLTGTGLKAISAPSPDVTLAVPRGEDLAPLAKKVSEYGHGEVVRQHIPNEGLVSRLETIDQGQPIDRLSDELREQYNDHVRREFVVVEIEVIALRQGHVQQRNEVNDTIAAIGRFLGPGILGQMYEHEYAEGVARVVIGCQGRALRELVEGQEWQTSITWFDARPLFQTFHSTLQDFDIDDLGEMRQPANGASVIGLLDSGVSAGNPFLAPIVRAELLFSFLRARPNDASDETGHGSGVGSLAGYYALNLARGAQNEGQAWIASARVLDENNECPERLLSSAISDAVKMLSPLGVRIFNLSVNVLARSWNIVNRRSQPKRSWIARAIDQLSRSEDVLFVISAGNLSEDTVEALAAAVPYPRYLADDQCTLLDPGQAALAITVGSVAPTTQLVGRAHELVAIAERNQPSPFTRRGPGIRGEIKPELVEYGGNLAINGEGRVRQNPGCSVMTATHSIAPAVSYDVGTSLAAPRVAHHAGRILHHLTSLGIAPTAPLLKAFLINSATYRFDGDELIRFENAFENDDRFAWQNVLGHGIADAGRATYCDEYGVVLFFQGTLEHNSVAFFEIPVPENLTGTPKEYKRLAVTVVYHPEIHLRGFTDYFGTALKWRLFRGDTAKDDVMTIMSSEVENDDARELEGLHKIQKRSRGSTQHDVFVWKDHRAEFSQHSYTLAITTFERWGRERPEPVPYAVVVRLEDESRTVPIYNEVVAAIRIEAPVEIVAGR